MADGGNSLEIQQPVKTEPVKRRGFLKTAAGVMGAGAAVLAGIGKSRTAEAQVVPTNPNQLPVKPEAPINKDVDLPSNIKEVCENRTQVAEKFLRRAPGQDTHIDVEYYEGPETKVTPRTGFKDIAGSTQKTLQNEALQVFYNPNKPISPEQMAWQMDLQAGMLVRESNGDKQIENHLSNSFAMHLGVNFDKIAATPPQATAEQMADLEAVSHVLGFLPDSGNIFIHKNRKQLAETVFDSTYAKWFSNQEELSKSLNKLSPKLKKAMSNIMLEGLELIMECAEPGTTLDKVGINRNVVDFVIGMSENPQHKFFFDKRAA